MLPRLAQPSEYMFSINHNSGYVHVRLTPESETFFGFEWEGNNYVYHTLSFGWQASPFICNTLSGAVAQFLRRLGIRNLFYLDDSILLEVYTQDESNTHTSSKILQQVYEEKKKSHPHEKQGRHFRRLSAR
jgi:hypothetical protein